MVIITAGMIGVGKTTLTEKLARHLGTQPFYEPVEDNPVLSDYYADPKRYGFSLQIYFLNKRFRMIKAALADDNNILDRSIYEDALFTEENFEEGNISAAEFEIYLDLLDNMMNEIKEGGKKRPDLLVYADADFDTIIARIKKRGRKYEQVDNNPEREDYYFRIWNKYHEWYENYNISPKVRIDLETLDLSNDDDVETVLAIIDEKLKEIRQ
ncbi:deoxynucleoside kinase [Weissella confusa]|uniref:deoxynucleoside kinase n=1 Tax=Weissella confusa TaxID=1583 RepID=UPI00223AEA73|nr:deoxynucleoside kinase [Weissella confusa]MCS9997138.1 deoxynucleoside kinase [Weissella confusa]